MIRSRRRVVVVLIAVGVSIWFVDALIDALFFGKEAFLDSAFLDVSAHELYFRLFSISVYSVVTFMLFRSLLKQRAAQGELQKHLTAVETSMDGIALFNSRHEYLYTNEAYARITGFERAGELIGKTFAMIYNEQQLAWIEKNVFPELERSGKWHGELLANRKDRTAFIQESTITRLGDGGCICVMRDITERRQQEDELRRSERLLNSIFASIHDPFCVFDDTFRIVKVNQAYADLKEKSVGDLVERTCFEVLENRDDACDDCVVRKTFRSGDPCAKEKKVTLRSGETLWLEIFTYPIVDDKGKSIQVIEYMRDVTDRKKSEEDRKRLIDRLEYLSSVDGLTGLLNRRALTEQLAYEVERARRYEAPLSIILCDMDNLKEINDKHGHLAGDMAIQLVSATLRNALRSVDIAGRYGGDEFLVILPETKIEGVRSIAEKVRETMQKTEIHLDKGVNVTLSVSMGIATLAAPPEEIDGFISRVDTALYNSKHAGRNRITVAE